MAKDKHCKFISTLPCVICGDPRGVDAAHVKSLPNGRLDGHTMGKRNKINGISLTVPLCRVHHDKQHSMNEAVFWEEYGVDAYTLACDLFKYSGDTKKAFQVLGKVAWYSLRIGGKND